MSTPVQKIFIKRLNVLALVSAVLFGLLLVQTQRMILLADLHNKGEALARILASVTLDAAMVHDYATMERYADDIVSDPAITSIEIRRADNERLAASGTAQGAHTDSLMVTKPITIGSTTFGEIRVELSTDRVNTLSRNLLLATFATVIFFHFLGIVLSRFALKKAVIEPLTILNRAIEKFSAGNLQEKIHISDPQEFSNIAQSFNEMATTIQQNFETLQKKQEELQMEQNKLATIVDSIADGLFVTDDRGVILSFNRSATDISGYTEQDAVGNKCSDLFQSTLCKDACALYQQGQTVRNKETFIVSKSANKLIVSVSSALLFDATGEAVGGVQTFRDITHEKKRQEMYCHTEKLAAIGQLAAGVAHEINNPLSNIVGYARMIKPGADDEAIQKRVSVIVEQARKCSDIVKGLLNYSRSSGAEPSLFRLEPLIEKVLAMVRYQAEKKEVALSFQPSGDQYAYADINKIEQVLFNLLLNALQTNPPPQHIWIETGQAGESCYFTVADDGPGIPEKDHQKIFDPFYTTKPVGQGTGLGLSICAGIIAEADGSIDIEKRTEGGVLFTVLLPSTEKEMK